MSSRISMASQLFTYNRCPFFPLPLGPLKLGSEAAQFRNEDRIKISPETVQSSGNISIKTASKSVQHRITFAKLPNSSFLLTSPLVASELIPIFQEEYRALRPRAPMPPFTIRFRKFVSLNTTIRLREGQVHASLSDLLEGAPESVPRAIAHNL